MTTRGYREDFLGGGVMAPLPMFSPELEGELVRADGLEGDIFAHYPNYTVVMNRKRRSPVYAAQNILQDPPFRSSKGKKWSPDTRVEDRRRPDQNYHQLNDDYYSDADVQKIWDRGHMAMRATSAWGHRQHEADRNSRETYYWSNAVLQHKNINQDEWRRIEDWVRFLEEDGNQRVCAICGPIYHAVKLSVEPSGREPASVPSAFFKVVMFRHRDAPEKLAVRAFVMPQDGIRMKSRGGWKPEFLQKYQVPIRLIERLSGLQFDAAVVEANPVYETDSEVARALGVRRFPEMHEIDDPMDVLDPGQARVVVRDQEVDVAIGSALINPAGTDRGAEWISITNLSGNDMDLTGWTLKDTKGRTCEISGGIEAGQARRIDALGAIRLANRAAGSLTLLNAQEERIDRVFYTLEEAQRPGVPVVFRHTDRFMRGESRNGTDGDAEVVVEF